MIAASHAVLLSSSVAALDSNWWSLRPLRNEPAPVAAAAPHPIDRFILQKLAERGLKPNPEASRETLLRRVYFDLIGLPPSASEAAAFLADRSPNAYENVVDRLLGSPRYGERWARHWMDLVHFAETHGNDQDRPRANAWPYRDYLVDSFNADKPYARFIQEQIAGDVLFPEDSAATVATAFIAAGPWDESSLLNIVEDTLDKKAARYLDRDDMVATTMSTFASTTVHCARCHNHKFDPITQNDYYGLQAVFAGVDRADRSYDPDPSVARIRAHLLAAKTNMPPPEGRTELRAALRAWEAKVRGEAISWQTLAPLSVESKAKSILTLQADRSVLAGGPRPEKDTYDVTFEAPAAASTGLRLELLLDDSLPHTGPGRQDNGNLHLSEIELSRETANGWSRVALLNPLSDFDQEGWGIAKLIDGIEATAWGIYPRVGQSHAAVFQLAAPLAPKTRFKVVLRQEHGGGHLIGRFRISVCDAAPPLRVSDLPDAIASIVASPESARTGQAREELEAFYWPRLMDEKLAKLPPQAKVYTATRYFVPEANHTPAKVPRLVQVLKRGDVNNPLSEASPGALACVPGLQARFAVADERDEGLRRAALARWLSDPRNVLVWRSIVNRVWQHHFGQGIVDTPNDFGRMGSQPTHPELLDWLALQLLESGGSLKQLHRLIVTSATYRQSTAHRPEAAAIDHDNRLLWRMNRTRLDAESIRDAVLLFCDSLDLRMGGPSARQFLQSPGIHVTPRVDYEHFDVDDPACWRRSVYRFIFRTLPDPFMDSLDCADASQLTPARTSSITALQALAMLNNQFMVRYSEHLAEKIERRHPAVRDAISAAYRIVYGRSPLEDELREASPYAARHGLANFCRLLLNSNEFVFVN